MAIYKETDNYNLKYPNTGDLSTVNEWGEVINETLEDIDTLQDVIAGELTTLSAKVDEAEADVDEVEDGLLQASGIPLLEADIIDVESKSPVSTETQDELDNIVDELETKYYSTLPTLISAATDTGGSTGSGAVLAYANLGSKGDVLQTENGAVMSIDEDTTISFLTKVEVYYTKPRMGANLIDAGLEDETDADGGTNIADFTNHSYVGVQTINESGYAIYKAYAEPTNISWDQRYNYRIGGANIYQVTEVVMYKDGINTDEWDVAINAVSNTGTESHFGINLDPDNKNITNQNVGVGEGYPKSID